MKKLIIISFVIFLMGCTDTQFLINGDYSIRKSSFIKQAKYNSDYSYAEKQYEYHILDTSSLNFEKQVLTYNAILKHRFKMKPQTFEYYKKKTTIDDLERTIIVLPSRPHACTYTLTYFKAKNIIILSLICPKVKSNF